MFALSGTLLVIHQICVAEHDVFLFPRGDIAFFQNELPMSFSTAFLDQFYGILYGSLWTDGLKPVLI
jgi:hypothetical protein